MSSAEKGGLVGALIEASVRNRFFVLLLALLASAGGVWALWSTPVDAIPDLSDVQVIVYTEYPGQAPQVVEDQVTYPLATSLLAVPYADDVRGYSFFGVSMVYVIFEDGTDLYWARSRVLESLNAAQGRLPEGVTPQLGPDATGVGWVYEYTLTDFSPRARLLREAWDGDHDGEASAADLATMEARYCKGSDVRAWNEDRCEALAARTCEGDTCHYRHIGNCSGLIFGQGVLLTAAHCVDGMVDHPERAKNSAVLMPGPYGTPDRLAIGDITVGKQDFDHHWVALGEENPVDVATIVIEDRGAPPVEIATELPAAGSPLFLVGYPRVERRPAADRKRSGYELNFGTPTASFGTLVDANAKDLPLCNVDGMQEHWALAKDCPEGEVEVDGEGTWKGVISRSVALADFDSCNGYSGAPVMDAGGRLVGVNITLTGQTDPQERFDPETRMVFVPIAPAMKRLGLEAQ